MLFEVLEQCKKDDLIRIEQNYIDSLKPQFNMPPTAGNTLGRICQQSIRELMSRIHKGKIISERHRKNISEKTKGVPKPLGFGEKVSKSMTGYIKTAEHRKNISLGNKGKSASPDRVLKMRKATTRFTVHQFDTNNNLIETFFSAYDASKKLDISIKNIQRACRGRYKTANNFKFTYEPRTSI